MISFLFLSPQIQDGDHYVKRPPPPSENHLHAIILMMLKLFFRAMESRIYFHHQFFFNRMCLSTQNPTWLVQVPGLSDVQLLFHMGI